jgi:hypothetical protein
MAAVLSMVAGGASAVAAAPAFADGPLATTVTVTANHPSILTGRSVSFNAVVSPSSMGKTKITGTITWMVTAIDGTVIPCSTASPLTRGGKSRCKIDKGVLLAGVTPFTATASYSGDANFAAGSGSGTLNVSPTSTRVKIALSAIPTGGAATTVTVTVVDGPATSLLGGNVVFSISSQTHAPGVSTRCIGSAPPPANNVVTLSGQTAVCELPAGWMIIPKMTVFNPRPSNGWSISAVYNGNESFTTSFAVKKGTARV